MRNVSNLVVLVVHGAVDELHHPVAVVADAQAHRPGSQGGRINSASSRAVKTRRMMWL